MKRFVSIMLTVILLLLTLGCGAGNGENAASTTQLPDQEDSFQVGFGKVNITPEYSVPLSGYGNSSQRMSTGLRSYLYAFCLAVSDGTNTVLLYSIDVGACYAPLVAMRPNVAKALGYSVENVHFSCTHIHSGVDLGNGTEASVGKYSAELEKWLIQAGKLALADLNPATMQIATVETEGLNFIRRYVLADGTYNGGDISDKSQLVGHEKDPDSTLQLVKFCRSDANDIILANFQLHPHRDTAGEYLYLIDSNIPGAFRDELEAKLENTSVIYFTGASGNINGHSAIAAENITPDYKAQGIALAGYALQAEGNYTPVDSGAVQIKTEQVVAVVDHTRDNLVVEAQLVWNRFLETNDKAASNEFGKQYGFSSVHDASVVIQKAAMADTQTIDIHAVSIGDVALIAVPYEMFDTTGMHIKEQSPYEMTVVMYLTNEIYGYMPDKDSFAFGGYEVDITKFEYGTAELFEETYLEMLNALHSDS